MRELPPDDQLFSLATIDILDHPEMVGGIGEVRRYRRGLPIPLKETQIFLVTQGVVQINTFYPSGDEALLALVSPGLPFGLPMTQVDPYNAIALTDTSLLMLTIGQLQENPALAAIVHRQTRHRLRQAEAVLAMLGYRRVEDRLRQFLILLAGEVGQTTPDGIRLSVRLTHQLIANATGTTRVTITRILGQLQREGWLCFDRQHHIILMRSRVGVQRQCC
jgi:CRP-like cAMP-binding protein